MNLSLLKTAVTALALACAGLATPAEAQAGRIQIDPITTPIVPTALLAGDRDFDGNGPVITLGTRLTVERNGRAIFAHVTMSAREIGGDGSATAVGPISFQVWRWKPSDGPVFVRRIVSNRDAFARFTSSPGLGPIGGGIIGPSEDGGMIVTRAVPPGNYLDRVTFLGDTLGDDISTDANPHGDTSIRRITFDMIDVEFTDRLVRR